MSRKAVVAVVVMSVLAMWRVGLGEPDHADHGKATTQPGKMLKVGDFQFAVAQADKVEAGKEARFELALQGDAHPKAIRGWIGVESARGSVKTKAHQHDGDYDIHIDVPDPIPADAKLWIEVETDAGKARASIDFAK